MCSDEDYFILLLDGCIERISQYLWAFQALNDENFCSDVQYIRRVVSFRMDRISEQPNLPQAEIMSG